MVNKCLIFYFAFMVLATFAMADDVNVTAEIDNNQAVENQSLKGTISVTHDQKNAVDVNSFILDQKPISAEFIREVQMSPNNPLVISFYRFELPGQAAGLYLLSPVRVKVGGREYRSTSSSYTVSPFSKSSPSARNAPSSTPSVPPTPQAPISTGAPVLKLEAKIEGASRIYPGERTKLVYHYLYRGNISLTEEKLPLLDAEGMIKIGEKEIKDYTEGDLSVNEISQEVEAVKAGDFSFGPSSIAGIANGSQKLTAEAPAVVVSVLPFPEQGKPASFNGAVGGFKLKTSLTSSPQVDVGDEMALLVEVTGQGNLKSVPLPNLCCQPGFSGFFRRSDLPPVGEMEGDTKKAVYRIRPLTDQIKAIPSVEFSYFDPKSGHYEMLHSEAIPITVKPSKTTPADAVKEKKTEKEQVAPKSYAPSPIEIEGIDALTPSDLHNKWFGSWWALAVIPAGLALLLYQMMMQGEIEKQRRAVKIETSEDLLSQAFKQKDGSSAFFDLLDKALKHSLVERGLMMTTDVATDQLSAEGLEGKVKALLSDVEEKRFAGKGNIDYGALRAQAKAIIASRSSGGVA